MGHSTRSTSEFIDLLADAEVTQIVDVRRFPHSRRHRQFDSEELANALQANGIAYTHLPDLGGRRGRAEGVDGQNGFWRHPSFRNYADYAMSECFQSALHHLLALARQQTCALMCAEAVWWRCHRRIIADYLIHHGAQVIHIMGKNRFAVAMMTKAAEPSPNGVLVYPGSIRG